MSTTNHDLTYVTMTNPDGTADSALYKRDPDGTWTHTTNATDTDAVVAILKTVGQNYRITSEITHLRTGGTWMPVVPDHLMRPTTPRQRIQTEIADARAEAKRLDHKYGTASAYDTGSADLHTRADAMQHVLDILDNHDDHN